MSDHPGTFQGESTPPVDVEWDDHATLHMKGDGQGVLDGFKSVRSGTLAELVGFVQKLPANEQGLYVIQKAGDHMLTAAEIVALAARDDFPA